MDADFSAGCAFLEERADEDYAPEEVEDEGDVEEEVHFGVSHEEGQGECGEHEGDGDSEGRGVDGVGDGGHVGGVVSNGEPVVFEVLGELDDVGGEFGGEIANVEEVGEEGGGEVFLIDAVGEEFSGELSEGVDEIEVWVEVLDDAFEADEGAHGVGEFGGDLDAEGLSGGDEVRGEGGDVEIFQGGFEVFLQDACDFGLEVGEDDASGGVSEGEEGACDEGVVAGLDGDDEAHEGLALSFRESSDESEVEESNFSVLGGEDVSRVRVAVKDAVAEDHVEGDGEDFVGHDFGVGVVVWEVGDFLSAQFAHDEDVLPAERVERLGEGEHGPVAVLLDEVGDVFAFAVEIEFGDGGAFKFGDEGGEVEVGDFLDVVVKDAGDEVEDVDIASYQRQQIWPLHFDDDAFALSGDASVDLCDRGRAERDGIEFGKDVVVVAVCVVQNFLDGVEWDLW